MDLSPAAPLDWGVAAVVGARLVRPGPTASRAELTDAVAALHRAAHEAIGHVSAISLLRPADGSEPAAASRTLVVDRSSWVRANARMLGVMTGGLTRPGRGPSAAGRWSGGVQAGTVLAAVSSRVLGQFDPFTPGPERPGTLLLVAPNVLRMERSLGVVPADFRLWVALHEQTHALQFAAAPWLTAHVQARASELLGDLLADDDDTGGESVLSRVAGLLSRRERETPGIEAVLTPSQRVSFESLGATMALLEGHADVTMDAVGPGVVPSVRTIRTRFDQRRQGTGRLDRLLRSLLGLDAKMAQYRDGAAFVRGVRGAVGTEGVNAVWEGPGNLPTTREIADPRAWVRRVHG